MRVTQPISTCCQPSSVIPAAQDRGNDAGVTGALSVGLPISAQDWIGRFRADRLRYALFLEHSGRGPFMPNSESMPRLLKKSRGAVLMFLSLWPVVLVSQEVGLPQKRGGLLLNDLQVLKEARVTGYEVHLAGCFTGISNIPIAWNVLVSNDSGGESTLKASAKAGEAWVGEAFLQKIGLQVIENRVEDKRFQVWGWVTVLDRGQERRLPLDNENFEFVERYARRVLK